MNEEPTGKGLAVHVIKYMSFDALPILTPLHYFYPLM